MGPPLQRDGAEGFILDLRNNPGGLVRSSLEIAGLWMDGTAQPTVFDIVVRGRGGLPWGGGALVESWLGLLPWLRLGCTPAH